MTEARRWDIRREICARIGVGREHPKSARVNFIHRHIYIYIYTYTSAFLPPARKLKGRKCDDTAACTGELERFPLKRGANEPDRARTNKEWVEFGCALPKNTSVYTHTSIYIYYDALYHMVLLCSSRNKTTLFSLSLSIFSFAEECDRSTASRNV